MELNLSHFSSLKLARFEFRLAASSDCALPPLPGSTLRGAFGYDWKTIACAAEAGEERGKCLLATTCKNPANCLYAAFFEPLADAGKKLSAGQKDAPRPFIFEPPLMPSAVFGEFPDIRLKKDDYLTFGLTVFGRFNDYLPCITDAVKLAARRGFGAARREFTFSDIAVLDKQGEKSPFGGQTQPAISLTDLVESRLETIDCRKPLTLRWLAPLRLRRTGELQTSLDFAEFVKSLSLRLARLCELYGEAEIEYDYQKLIEKSRRVRTVSSNLWRLDFDRYSNKRERKMPQDGLLGEITFAGAEIIELLPLVVAGEFLHVGSGTSFGLGRYEIV